MKKTEYLLESFKNIQDLIKFADQKAAAILVVCGLILTIFNEVSKNLVFISGTYVFWNIALFISGLVLVISIVSILYYCIFSIIKPKFAKNYDDKQYSTFYFEHIAKNGLNYFKEEITEISEKKIEKDLTEQIYEVSNILLSKNRKLAWSMNLLFGAICALLIFVFSYQMIKV